MLLPVLSDFRIPRGHFSSSYLSLNRIVVYIPTVSRQYLDKTSNIYLQYMYMLTRDYNGYNEMAGRHWTINLEAVYLALVD
jgi:hypothetical protein